MAAARRVLAVGSATPSAVVDEEQPLSLSLLVRRPPASSGSSSSQSSRGGATGVRKGSGIAWVAGDSDPDYYWADATGKIRWTKHCLWEEIK